MDIDIPDRIKEAILRYTSFFYYLGINGYLLDESYFSSADFGFYLKTMKKVNSAEKLNSSYEVSNRIKEDIQCLDDYFMNYSQRNEKDDLIVYRGMYMTDLRLKTPNKRLDRIHEPLTESDYISESDNIEITNFVSTTTSLDVARKY